MDSLTFAFLQVLLSLVEQTWQMDHHSIAWKGKKMETLTWLNIQIHNQVSSIFPGGVIHTI